MASDEATPWQPIAADYYADRGWRVLLWRYHPTNGIEYRERAVDPDTYLKSEQRPTV